jgi:cell division protein FtsB
MIDPISVAIAATSVAGLNGGISMIQTRKINEQKKVNKRQRIELFTVEAGLVASILTAVIDGIVVRKAIKDTRAKNKLSTEELHNRINNLTAEVTDLSVRVNSLNMSALDAKMDEVLAATAPKNVPKKDDTEEGMGD